MAGKFEVKKAKNGQFMFNLKAGNGEIILIDEVMTPDSSRFWPAAAHRPGEEPASWDKQILRNHLETLPWNHEPPPPPLPAEVLERTSERYREVLEILFPEEAAAWRTYL